MSGGFDVAAMLSDIDALADALSSAPRDDDHDRDHDASAAAPAATAAPQAPPHEALLAAPAPAELAAPRASSYSLLDLVADDPDAAYRIVARFPLAQQLALCSVCRALRTLIYASVPRLVMRRSFDGAVDAVARFTGLRAIELQVPTFEPAELLAMIEHLRGDLVELVVGGTPNVPARTLNFQVLDALRRVCARRLHELKLQHCSMLPRAGVAALLPACLNLKTLHLHACPVYPSQLELLSNTVSTLRHLDLSHVTSIDDAALRGQVARFTSLKSLTLNSVVHISAEGLTAAVARMPRLHSLALCCLNLDRSVFALLADTHLPRTLHTLHMPYSISSTSAPLEQPVLDALARFDRLVSLDIRCLPFGTADSLAHCLGAMPSLTSCRASGTMSQGESSRFLTQFDGFRTRVSFRVL